MKSSTSFRQQARSARDAPRPLSEPLSTLTYRSRLAAPLSESDLQALLASSRAKNRASGITGLMLYDGERFFQWLEGPRHAVAQLWASVQRDPRHTEVELIEEQVSPIRMFADWDLKFAMRPSTRRDVARPTPMSSSSGKENGLRRLQPSSAHQVQDMSSRATDSRIAEIAQRLLAGDPLDISTIAPRGHGDLTAGALCAEVVEPVARLMGDLWQADAYSELDITLALGRLQSGFRELVSHFRRSALEGSPKVLLAPAPLERHLLATVLQSELLWQAGWDAQVEFPADDRSLDALVSGTRFDAVVLSLSLSFRREDRIARLARTIASVRAASLNPAMIVLVAGRVFHAATGTSAGAGANAGLGSVIDTEPVLIRALTPLLWQASTLH